MAYVVLLLLLPFCANPDIFYEGHQKYAYLISDLELLIM